MDRLAAGRRRRRSAASIRCRGSTTCTSPTWPRRDGRRPLDLQPLGRARQPPLPDRLLRRLVLALARAAASSRATRPPAPTSPTRWWSHDIGGHVGAVDPELYVRWVQFGALSPVLRLHSTNDPGATSGCRGASATRCSAAARAAFRLRYELVPYLYTAARIAADTGVAPVRPVSWIAPEHDGAYARARPVPARRRDPRRARRAPGRPGDRARDGRRLAAGRATGSSARPASRSPARAGSGSSPTSSRVPQFVRPGTVAAARAGRAEHRRPARRPPHPRGLAGATGPRGCTTTTTSWTDGDGRPRRARVRIAGGVAPRRYTVRLHAAWRARAAWPSTAAEIALGARARDDAHGRAPAAARRARRRRGAGARARSTTRPSAPPTCAARRHRRRGRDPGADARPSRRAGADRRAGGPGARVDRARGRRRRARPRGRRRRRARPAASRRRSRGRSSAAARSRSTARAADGGGRRGRVRGAVRVGRDVRAAPLDGGGDGALGRRRRRARAPRRGRSARRSRSGRAPSRRRTRPRRRGRDWTAAPGYDRLPGADRAGRALSFPDLAPARAGADRVACARTTLVVGADREVAFSYAAGGDVAIAVDGAELDPDPAGTGPVPFYTLEPALRTSAPVALGAGRHEVVFTLPGAARGEGARLVPVGERGRPRRRRRAAGRRPGLTVTMGGCRARPPRCRSCSRCARGLRRLAGPPAGAAAVRGRAGSSTSLGRRALAARRRARRHLALRHRRPDPARDQRRGRGDADDRRAAARVGRADALGRPPRLRPRPRARRGRLGRARGCGSAAR